MEIIFKYSATEVPYWLINAGFLELLIFFAIDLVLHLKIRKVETLRKIPHDSALGGMWIFNVFMGGGMLWCACTNLIIMALGMSAAAILCCMVVMYLKIQLRDLRIMAL